jgi:hypothetical protein
MCSTVLLHHYQGQRHDIAAFPCTKRALRTGFPEQRESAAIFRCSRVVTLLAASVLLVLASEAMAQVEEIGPSILSSGLREANAAQTPVTPKPGQPPANRSLLDIAGLPQIDAIGSGSDIRVFLAPGVPQDLTRAALRRAWLTDPAIRDFIGLSENSWDFNAPPDDAHRPPARVAEDAANRMLNAAEQSATHTHKSGR